MTTGAQTPGERALAARLLSLAAHELRTPVSVVSGYLRMLQRDDTLTERQRKMIDEADKACVRLVGIISELSEVGKLDDGRTALQAEGMDLTGLLREVGKQATEALDRGVRLELHGCDDRLWMRGDRAHLMVTFAALTRAVLREQPDDTVVVLECARRENAAHIAIGRADQLQAGAPRSEAPFDDQRGGLGLALPIARRVIEAHSGRIWSPATADGSTTARSAVFISLPLEP